VPLRRSLVAGFVFFALVLSLGRAIAGDSGSSQGGGTVGVTVTNQAPVVTQFDIRNPANNASLMGSQLDVRTTYWVWVTVFDENNWSDVKQLDVNFWNDGGVNPEKTYYQQTGGANLRINLTYANGGANTPTTGQWSASEGKVNFTSSTVSIYTITPNQRYSFKIPFELRSQVRQANDPVASGTSGYDDLGSWNAQFVALDNGNNNVTQRANETSSVYYEFGIYKYTAIAFTNTWTGTGAVAPGASISTNTRTISHVSNAPYRLSVYVSSTLSDVTDAIAVTNIMVTAAGDSGDAVTTNTSFAGVGSGFPIYLLGDASTPHAFDATGDAETTGLQFKVNVPLGTPAGTYTANVVVKVEQP
jgi:hypothetical protein